MNKNQKVSNVIRFTISLAMALLCFFSLFFCVWLCKGGSSENGFSFLGFDSTLLKITEDYKGFVSLIAVFVYIQILFSVIYLFYLLASLPKILNSNEKNSSISYAFNVFCVMFSLVYMVFGFVSKNLVIEYVKTGLDISGIFDSLGGLSGMSVPDVAVPSISTQAFIPVIINVILLILFFVCPMIIESCVTSKALSNNTTDMPDSKFEQNNSKVQSQKVQSLSDIQRIDLIRQYHELVEKGILSQEDFDAKKKEILGL